MQYENPGAVRIVMLALLGAGVGLGAPPVAQTEPSATRTMRPAAVVASVDGRVWIQRTGASEPLAAELGTRLRTGDVVRADEASATTIYFSGGHIVRVPAGSRLEIISDAASAPDGTNRIARMSDRSLKVLEEGLWVLSDPRGGVLLQPMRGGPWAAEDEAGDSLLSPRRETVTTLRPVFYWASAGGDVRITVGERGRVVWRSRKMSGSSLVYPESAPALQPDRTYEWWLEAAGDQVPLTEAVSFTMPGVVLLQDMATFESEMRRFSPDDDADPVSSFLRCAYYEQLGAWSPFLWAASRLSGSGEEGGFARRALTQARRRMGLSKAEAQRLLAIQAVHRE